MNILKIICELALIAMGILWALFITYVLSSLTVDVGMIRVYLEGKGKLEETKDDNRVPK